MPQLGFTPEQNQRTQEGKRRGSVMLTLGWIVLWMTAMVGCFVFQDIREGSSFWLVWSGIQGFAGLVLVAAGVRYRYKVWA